MYFKWNRKYLYWVTKLLILKIKPATLGIIQTVGPIKFSKNIVRKLRHIKYFKWRMVYTKGYKYKPKMANGKLENGTKVLKQFHLKQKNT